MSVNATEPDRPSLPGGPLHQMPPDRVREAWIRSRLQCRPSSEPENGVRRVADSAQYDLVVIGTGPGGYVGAIRAAQLGMKTAVIERNRLGGVCLNWGCIPSKALLHNAELYSEAVTHGDEWGFHFEGVSVDWDKVIGRSRGVADKLNKGVGFLMKKNKIDHIEGHAKIVAGPRRFPVRHRGLEADDDYYHGTGSEVIQTVTASKIMIATGAAPRELPFARSTAPRSSDRTMRYASVTSRWWSSARVPSAGSPNYNAMGTDVTVVEMVDRILPVEDEEVSKACPVVQAAGHHLPRRLQDHRDRTP